MESHMPPEPVNASAAGQILLGGELTVNRFGFGALHIAGRGSWGEPADVDEAKRTLRRALELGVNFIDTADSYGPEISERLIAETLHPYPQGLVISTKGGMVRLPPAGRQMGARSIYGLRSRGAWPDSGWSASTFTISIGPIQRCRSKNR